MQRTQMEVKKNRNRAVHSKKKPFKILGKRNLRITLVYFIIKGILLEKIVA